MNSEGIAIFIINGVAVAVFDEGVIECVGEVVVNIDISCCELPGDFRAAF